MIGELQAFYELLAVAKYSLEWVSVQIGGVDEKNGLVNSYPLNYYSKYLWSKINNSALGKQIIQNEPAIKKG